MADGAPQSAQPLFRPEVALRRSNAWLGELQVSQPLPLRLPILLGVAFILCGLAFVSIASYGARIPVTGELLPVGGIVTVEADMVGTVGALLLAEGALVEIGQPIATLRSPREIAGGDSVKLIERELNNRSLTLMDALERLDTREAHIRADATEEIQHLQGELVALNEEAAIVAGKQRLAKEAIERVRFLQGKGLISTIEVSRYEGDLLSAEASELTRRREVLSTRRQRDAARRMLAERIAEIEDKRDQVARELSTIKQEQAELQSRTERVITSPITGRISAWLVDVGSSVAAGTQVVTLTPNDAEIEAVLHAPSQAITGLEVGTQLLLRIEAFPYQRFGLQPATVVNVSGTTLQDTSRQSAYRVRARLDAQNIDHEGRQYPLLPGMKVDAFVMVDYGSPGANVLGSVRNYLQELLDR